MSVAMYDFYHKRGTGDVEIDADGEHQLPSVEIDAIGVGPGLDTSCNHMVVAHHERAHGQGVGCYRRESPAGGGGLYDGAPYRQIVGSRPCRG